MNCILYLQFIALGTGDGTIKLLDHAGTTLMDRIYTLVGTLSVVVPHLVSYFIHSNLAARLMRILTDYVCGLKQYSVFLCITRKRKA